LGQRKPQTAKKSGGGIDYVQQTVWGKLCHGGENNHAHGSKMKSATGKGSETLKKSDGKGFFVPQMGTTEKGK